MRLIDADDLKNSFNNHYRSAIFSGDVLAKNTLSAIVGKIDKAATIDAAPVVHGKWVGNSGYSKDCSECSKSVEYKRNYCPNCGAKME